MLWIERPSGRDISDERIELTVKDENGLRAGTLFIETVEVIERGQTWEEVRIRVDSVPGDKTRFVCQVGQL